MTDLVMSARRLFEQLMRLQSLVIDGATYGPRPADDEEYEELRSGLLAHPLLGPSMPAWVKASTRLSQVRSLMQKEDSHYKGRREFIGAQLAPLINAAEARTYGAALDEVVSDHISQLSQSAVQRTWRKALARRAIDPEGAITSARTLLEDVCKHILEATGMAVDDKADLPRLYGAVTAVLDVAGQGSRPRRC